MAATMVIEPVKGGWSIVNYDDFRNSMSAFIDRSFIPYPSEESGITDERAINEVADYIGASDWITTSELANEIDSSNIQELLDDEELQSERKINDKKGIKMRESSKKTASFYDFYDEFANPDGSGMYSLYYGEKGNKEYYIQLYAEESDDGSELNCYLLNTYFDTLEEFTAETWDEAKEMFMDECDSGKFDFELSEAYDGKNDNLPWEERFSTKKTSSSVKKSSEYEFWDKDDSDPTFITGRYGIPGDYTNSRQWNAIETDDGRWDVSVVGADGFPKEIGLYQTISEAGSALLQYLNENGITASFNKEGRMSASVRKSYIGSFWGDTQDNGFGYYEYYYGEDGEENNSVMLYGTPTNDGVDCVVVSPEGDTLDLFSADNWEDAKDRFDTDCRINHLYDDYVYDPQDPYIRYHETASVRTSYDQNGPFQYWDQNQEPDSYYGKYGVAYSNDPTDNLEYNIYYDEEDGGDGCYGEVYFDDEIVYTVDSGTFDEVENNILNFLDVNAADYIGGRKTASVKTSKITNSNGYEFDDSQWGAIVNLMDDEVREQVANELDDPTKQEFFDAYAKAYEDEFGEEWELDKANPIW